MTTAPDNLYQSTFRIWHARLLVFVVFVLLRAGDVVFTLFGFSPDNPVPAMRGVALGAALAGTVCLAALWRRQIWSRYVLIFLNWAMVGVFSMPGLMILDSPPPRPLGLFGQLAAGLVLYIAGNIVLISSRRLHHLATRPGSGG